MPKPDGHSDQQPQTLDDSDIKFDGRDNSSRGNVDTNLHTEVAKLDQELADPSGPQCAATDLESEATDLEMTESFGTWHGHLGLDDSLLDAIWVDSLNALVEDQAM